MKRAIPILILAAATITANAATLVDDFTTGTFTTSVAGASGASSGALFQTGSMLGGIRADAIRITSNPLGLIAGLGVSDYNGGFVYTSNSTLLGSEVGIGWGFKSDANPSGYATSDLNANFSGDTSLKLDFLANDLPLDLTVAVQTNGGGYATKTVSVPGGQFAPFSVAVNYADLTGASFSIGDIDQIALFAKTSPSGDFALSHVESVPEPAPMIVMGLGLVGLLARKRK